LWIEPGVALQHAGADRVRLDAIAAPARVSSTTNRKKAQFLREASNALLAMIRSN
jgi:endonuclease YncB( thermonuclease family)